MYNGIFEAACLFAHTYAHHCLKLCFVFRSEEKLKLLISGAQYSRNNGTFCCWEEMASYGEMDKLAAHIESPESVAGVVSHLRCLSR